MNVTNPDVSVIILTYNSERYILRALKSLQNQTFSNFEIIVVDAGSTDGTRQISCIPKVRWLDLPNSDMGMARNYGVQNSNGRYLMFLDSDDYYLENKMYSQVKAMDSRSDIDAIFSPAYIYKAEKRQKLGIKSSSRKHLSLTDIIRGNCYSLGTMCIRRSAWDRGLSFDEGELGRYGEDWRFQLKMATLGFRFDVTELPMFVVELRTDSHTSWEIQAKMKELALASVEEVLHKHNLLQNDDSQKQSILDDYRLKLIVSFCLVGRHGKAWDTLEKIKSSRKKTVARMIISSSTIMPSAWRKAALSYVWMIRQNRTFKWEHPSPDIYRQLSELGVSW